MMLILFVSTMHCFQHFLNLYQREREGAKSVTYRQGVAGVCAVQVHTHHAPNQQLDEVPDQGMGEQKVIVSASRTISRFFFHSWKMVKD